MLHKAYTVLAGLPCKVFPILGAVAFRAGAIMAGADRRLEPCVTLYTKADCELCHEAKATLLALQDVLGFELEEIDITTDAALHEAFCEEIPVGYLDGRKLFKYRVDPALLRRQLDRRRGWPVGRWFSHRRSAS
jgi:Glutaredoxin-like domain (DUF836)